MRTISPTYHSYKEEYEESTKSTEGNSLPLCFSSFKLLKENFKIITEAKECVLMPNHTDSLEQIDKKLQQSSHVFDDPVTCYTKGFISSKLQPLVEDESENVDDEELKAEKPETPNMQEADHVISSCHQRVSLMS
jgi:hypothetical protein